MAWRRKTRAHASARKRARKRARAWRHVHTRSMAARAQGRGGHTRKNAGKTCLAFDADQIGAAQSQILDGTLLNLLVHRGSGCAQHVAHRRRDLAVRMRKLRIRVQKQRFGVRFSLSGWGRRAPS